MSFVHSCPSAIRAFVSKRYSCTCVHSIFAHSRLNAIRAIENTRHSFTRNCCCFIYFCAMVYEASLGGVFRIILWILIISFIIRLVARLAIPRVVRGAQERMQEEMRRRQEAARPPRREGQVTVETDKRSSAHADKGDYVDFVEIKED